MSNEKFSALSSYTECRDMKLRQIQRVESKIIPCFKFDTLNDVKVTDESTSLTTEAIIKRNFRLPECQALNSLNPLQSPQSCETNNDIYNTRVFKQLFQRAKKTLTEKIFRSLLFLRCRFHCLHLPKFSALIINLVTATRQAAEGAPEARQASSLFSP